MRDYITIPISIKDWRYFDDAFMLRFYLTLVLDANEDDKKWHGIIIKRGQLVTSLSHLAMQFNKSMRQADKNSVEKIKRSRDNCKFNHKIYYDNHSGL